jgi:hypothetical protein
MKRILMRNGWAPLAMLLVFGMLFIALSTISCKKKSGDSLPVDIHIQANSLVEYEAEITQDKTIDEGVGGWNLAANEIYAGGLDEKIREYYYNVLDIDTLAVKRTLHLPIGDRKSPNCFYSPGFFKYVDGNYFVVDKYDKLVVYDRDFRYLYASMYYQLRDFIDIFKWDNRVMFVIGTKEIKQKNRGSEIQVFTVPEGKRPEKIDTLTYFEYINFLTKGSQKHQYRAPIAPNTFGFEKDGKVYFNDPMNNAFRVYDLQTKKITKIELSFLKTKKFADKQVSQFAYQFGDRLEADLKKDLGLKIEYKAYPDDRYYFALFDVGKDRIGFVGDIAFDPLYKYRLDVIDCKTFKYIESIWLPIGTGFYYFMNELNSGNATNFHDLDKGVFIWGDYIENKEEEEREYMTHISRFKLKPFPGKGK